MYRKHLIFQINMASEERDYLDYLVPMVTSKINL